MDKQQISCAKGALTREELDTLYGVKAEIPIKFTEGILPHTPKKLLEPSEEMIPKALAEKLARLTLNFMAESDRRNRSLGAIIQKLKAHQPVLPTDLFVGDPNLVIEIGKVSQEIADYGK